MYIYIYIYMCVNMIHVYICIRQMKLIYCFAFQIFLHLQIWWLQLMFSLALELPL